MADSRSWGKRDKERRNLREGGNQCVRMGEPMGVWAESQRPEGWVDRTSRLSGRGLFRETVVRAVRRESRRHRVTVWFGGPGCWKTAVGSVPANPPVVYPCRPV